MRVFILAALASSAFATAPGIRASVSTDGLNYVAGVFVPVIEKKFSTITIPDYSTKKDDVTVDITDGVCDLKSLGSARLGTDVGKGLSGSLNGISVSCSAHVHAKLDIWPHPSCSFDLSGSVSGGSASLIIDATADAGHVHVAAGSTNVNVGDFDIHFSGGICGFVANLIKDIADFFFKSSVEHLVENEIDSILTSFINTDANNILNSIPIDIPLPLHPPYDIAELEFSLTDNPTFASGYIGADIEGGVVNKATKTPAPFPAPSIPTFVNSSADHYIQIFLSPYVIESAVWVYQQAGLANATVHHDLIPASFPVQLNTTDLAIIAPGIKTSFPNDWVDIGIKVPEGTKANVTSSPSAGVALNVPLQLEFNAETTSGDKNAFTLGCTFSGAIALTAVLNASSGYPMIAGNLSYLECPLQVLSSNVGAVNPGLAKDLVNFVLADVIVPLVNDVLTIGIPLPTLDGLTFRDVDIVNGDGYVLVATDFTYNPSSLSTPALTAPMPVALRGAAFHQ